MTVMIGVDPHKGSHTAVGVDAAERSLAELRVRSGPKQLERLLKWAEQFPERTWAIENATGLGYLLAQQLVAAGERVLDVQPKLAARVRLLATESTNKNDPHERLSVAVAALRSPTPKEVGVEDHAAVMKLWSRRHRNLSSSRTQIACRLHAVLCDLVAGGVPDEIYAEKAASLLADVEPDTAVAAARVELAEELLDDLRRVDHQLAESKKRLEQVVAASGTTVIDIFGVGPVVAATVVGVTGDIARFPTRDRFAAFNGTAPIEVSSGGRKVWRLSRRGNRTLNHAIHMAAVTQLRSRTAPAAATTTARSPRARPRRKRCGRSSAASATPSGPPWSPTPDAPPHGSARKAGPGGQPGTTLSPARPAHTPRHRLFGQATPEPDRRLRPTSEARDERRREHRRPPEDLLDNQRGLVPPAIAADAARPRPPSKVYGQGDTAVTALDDVTVGFPAARFTAIMGPSGSGKSTLMHCTAGPDASGWGGVRGERALTLSERALTRLRRDRGGSSSRRSTWCHASRPWRTSPSPGRWPASATRRWIDHVVRPSACRPPPAPRVGRPAAAGRRGQALASRPAIIFADEPTGNLDSRPATRSSQFMRRPSTRWPRRSSW